MAEGRVYGRIESKDLAMIFARAARLAGDTPGEERTRELGKRLLEEVLDQARSRRPEGSSDTHDALPAAQGAGSRPRRMDLQGLRGKIDQLITQAREAKAKSSDGDATDPATSPAPTPSGKFRRPGGRLGTDTIDGMFLKGGQVKFDGYMNDVEGLLVELYDTFMAASSEGVDVFEMLDAGTLLGDSVDGLEKRRAGRRARKLSGTNTIPGLGQARELKQGQSPSGRTPRPSPASGRNPRPSPPSGRNPRPSPPSDRLRRPSPASDRLQRAEQPTEPMGTGRKLTPAAVQFIKPGVLSVRCACNVEREIDTSVLRPWRVRCKRCQQVLFDPSATMVVGDAEVAAEDTQELDRWVSGSQQHLRPLDPGDTVEAMRCPTHPLQFVIAACKQCNRLVCRACVDQVGDALVCTDCHGGAHDSATFQGPSVELSARDVKQAFQRQLQLTGMEAWLERGPRGGARMIQVIYDTQRRLFKLPLDPVVQAGHQIRFPDGRLFDVQVVRTCDTAGAPCYQEVEAHQVG